MTGVSKLIIIIDLNTNGGLHPCRALAHVIRHPASDHMDDIGLGQHYENIHTRVTVKSLREYRPPPSQHNVPQTHGPFLASQGLTLFHALIQERRR